MEVDEGKGDTKELLENATIIAKGLEVMSQEGICEMIKQGQSLKYLSKLISVNQSSGQISEAVQTISL